MVVGGRGSLEEKNRSYSKSVYAKYMDYAKGTHTKDSGGRVPLGRSRHTDVVLRVESSNITMCWPLPHLLDAQK